MAKNTIELRVIFKQGSKPAVEFTRVKSRRDILLNNDFTLLSLIETAYFDYRRKVALLEKNGEKVPDTIMIDLSRGRSMERPIPAGQPLSEIG